MSSVRHAVEPPATGGLIGAPTFGSAKRTTLKASNLSNRKSKAQDVANSGSCKIIRSQSLIENSENVPGSSAELAKRGTSSDSENTVAPKTPRKYFTKMPSTGELSNKQSKKNRNRRTQAGGNADLQLQRTALKRTLSFQDLENSPEKPKSPPRPLKRFRSDMWKGSTDITTAPTITRPLPGIERWASMPNLSTPGRRPPSRRNEGSPSNCNRDRRINSDDFKENIDPLLWSSVHSPELWPSTLVERRATRTPIRRTAERPVIPDAPPPATVENALLRLPGSTSNVRIEAPPALDIEDGFSDVGDDDLFASLDIDALFEVTPEHSGPGQVAPANEATSAPPLQVFEEPISSKRKPFSRFLVMEVLRSEYELDSLTGTRGPEQILRLLDESTQIEQWLHLREDWWQTDIDVGDYLHLVNGEFDSTENRCIADNSRATLVIAHPDCLISATSLSESFGCLRKAILQDRIRSQGEITPPLVYGKMMHCLLQTCLKANSFTTAHIEREIDALIVQGIQDLHAIGETEVFAKAHLLQFVPDLQTWAAKFVGPSPKPDAVLQTSACTGNDAHKKTTICINKILDIEENIWSPTYGVKGMIDASVQVQVRQGTGRPKTLATPFEFKTGRSTAVVAHRAQTILYTLMMSERYGVSVASGLLYYMRAGGLVHVPVVDHEIRGLMIARNAMSFYLNQKTKLPPVIQRADTCQRCYALDKCLLYHKAVEFGTAETSALGHLFDKQTSHLTPAQLEFFEKWERLITIEEGDLHSQRKEIWTLLGKEREQKGRCFSGLQITHKSVAGSGAAMQYRFGRAVRASVGDTLAADCDQPLVFTNSHITVGDMVTISTEAGHYALNTGFVTELQPGSVTITTDRQLRGPPRRIVGDFDEVDNQSFQGLLEEANDDQQYAKPTLYRIDKDEPTSGMGFVRANLVALLAQGGNERQRRLIVDLEAPTFHNDAEMSASASAIMDPSLNEDQQKAVQMVLSAQDYALILGMPGTGKTTTIAHIIRALVKLGKSVLLTSYTHTAVDNVLLKLREDAEPVPFLRLGSTSKIHPAIASSNTLAAAKIETVAQLEEFYADKRLVATTCLGLGHSLFSKRKFDYCIVDEASQLTLPVCLGPVRFANAFVLVGDNYQLPPLVRSLEAREQGLTSSLFKILSEAHPAAVVNLEHQYRMCKDVMLLSNVLVYGNRLRCGTEEVANARLKLPTESEGIRTIHAADAACASNVDGCWLRLILDPNRRVLFLCTDEVPGPETRPSDDRVQNDVEATIVAHCVEALLRCGVPERELGVISPYRSQLKIIGQALRHRRHLAIQTVDKFQGTDKECVIVSLVRSNATGNVGELLRDWRRINVAFTRAKKKLIIIGSRLTLNNTGVFPEFFKIIDDHKWELMLPANAHMVHKLPFLATGDDHSTPRSVEQTANEEKDGDQVNKPNGTPLSAEIITNENKDGHTAGKRNRTPRDTELIANKAKHEHGEDKHKRRSSERAKASSRQMKARQIAAKIPSAGVGLLGHLLEEA
ncbi:Tripartite DNA replication factor [Geranomyces michiganensis]|nr:Tripartite DNA replication factor [Geranomyces michiganensis]